jgi:DNA primase
MKQKIADAPTVIDFFLERALERFPSSSAQGKIQAVEFLAPLLRAIPKPEHREAYASDLRVRLGIHQAEVFTHSIQRGRGWGDDAPPGNRAASRSASGPASGPVSGRLGQTPEPVGAPNLTAEGLRGEDRLQLRYLNRLIRHVEHWEYFEDADPELFSRREFASVFSRIHATARDVREGAAPPDDWLEISENESERQILIRILMFEELYLSGELQKRETEPGPEERNREFQELTTRLRRLKNRRLRSQETHQFRLQPASYEEERHRLARFVDHSKSVIRETETLFEADSPPA